MPYYLVGIRGDPDRAAGLLAKAGIQNVADDAPRTLTARLSANDGASGLQRVRSALEGEPFAIEDHVRLDSDS